MSFRILIGGRFGASPFRLMFYCGLRSRPCVHPVLLSSLRYGQAGPASARPFLLALLPTKSLLS